MVADAEAEVEQGREADEEADDGVEAFEGDDGDQAEGAVIGDGVAEKRGEGQKKGVHGSAVRRENENDYEKENDLEDGLLVLAATVRRGRSRRRGGVRRSGGSETEENENDYENEERFFWGAGARLARKWQAGSR